MTKEYKYKPPFKYLALGIGSLLCSFIFAKVIWPVETLLFSIAMGLFFLMLFLMGSAFLLLYIRNYRNEPLMIGPDFIEVPGRWKSRRRILKSEITSIIDFDTYDHVIEVVIIDKEVRLIEKSYMNAPEFREVLTHLGTWAKELNQEE